MAIDKKAKKSVIEDWRKSFPYLTSYAANKFYKLVGPVLIGLDVIKLPMSEEYRPHFVIYPLWRRDIRTCLDTPIIMKEFHDKKGFQYSISYDRHSVFFAEVLEAIMKQTPLSLDEKSISLKKLIAVMNERSTSPPLSRAPNSYLQAELMASAFKAALFVSPKEAQIKLDEINKRNWDANNFKAFGFDVANWLQDLRGQMDNREDFLRQIQTNKLDRKVSQLRASELTL